MIEGRERWRGCLAKSEHLLTSCSFDQRCFRAGLPPLFPAVCSLPTRYLTFLTTSLICLCSCLCSMPRLESVLPQLGAGCSHPRRPARATRIRSRTCASTKIPRSFARASPARRCVSLALVAHVYHGADPHLPPQRAVFAGAHIFTSIILTSDRILLALDVCTWPGCSVLLCGPLTSNPPNFRSVYYASLPAYICIALRAPTGQLPHPAGAGVRHPHGWRCVAQESGPDSPWSARLWLRS